MGDLDEGRGAGQAEGALEVVGLGEVDEVDGEAGGLERGQVEPDAVVEEARDPQHRHDRLQEHS